MKAPFLSERQIEARAGEVLAEYAHLAKTTVTCPVPIEQIIDQVLDIPILWESIPAQNGREIVSKITQPMFNTPARIVLNEDFLASKFRNCPGLERTALAHEAGHAMFHLEHSRIQQLDLGLEMSDAFVSQTESFMDGFATIADARRRLGPMGDDWWREWQAHTFMRYILMPRHLLLPLLKSGAYQHWPTLYKLREQLGVTISALVVHLEKLGFIHVDERGNITDLTAQSRRQVVFDLG